MLSRSSAPKNVAMSEIPAPKSPHPDFVQAQNLSLPLGGTDFWEVFEFLN